MHTMIFARARDDFQKSCVQKLTNDKFQVFGVLSVY